MKHTIIFLFLRRQSDLYSFVNTFPFPHLNFFFNFGFGALPSSVWELLLVWGLGVFPGSAKDHAVQWMEPRLQRWKHVLSPLQYPLGPSFLFSNHFISLPIGGNCLPKPCGFLLPLDYLYGLSKWFPKKPQIKVLFSLMGETWVITVWFFSTWEQTTGEVWYFSITGNYKYYRIWTLVSN